MSENLRRALRRLDRPVVVPEELSGSLFERVADTAATKEGRVRDDLAGSVIDSLELPERSVVRRAIRWAAAVLGVGAVIAAVVLPNRGDDSGEEPIPTTVAATSTSTQPSTTTTQPPPPPRRTPQVGLPAGPPGWTALDPGPLAGTPGVSQWTGGQLFVWAGDGAASYNPRLDVWTEHASPPVAFDSSAVVVWTGAEIVVVSSGGAAAVFNPAVGEWEVAPAAPSELRAIVDAVWMGTEVLVVAHATDEPRGPGDLVAATYDPATRQWSSVAAPPVQLSYGDASWSGTEVVIYGGWLGPNNEPRSSDGNAAGARFDPATKSWSLLPAQSLSPNAVSSVWAGGRLVAWDYNLEAATYDLEGGWGRLSPVPLPSQECVNHTAAIRMQSGPGVFGWYCDSAAVLDLDASVWQRVAVPLGADLAPLALADPVSALDEVYFWGPDSFWVFTPDLAAPGGAVDAGGGWSRLAPSPADQRTGATTIWAEEPNEIIIWGGREEPDGPAHNDGAVYSVERDDWYALPPAPIDPRADHAAIWTGSDMIVWGGGLDSRGAAYNPASGRWRAIADAPLRGPQAPSVVWTDTEALFWGGRNANEAGSTPAWEGAAYDPASDSWRTIPAAPIAPREEHTAVWTGSEMIVWGGREGEAGLASGAAFDPATDTWRQLAELPELELTFHSAVWTGREMVVLGANLLRISREDGVDAPLFAGAAYDPLADTWRPIAPSPFLSVTDLGPRHSAVWSESRVAVWVGSALAPEGPQVWLYNPFDDAWQKGAVAPAEPFGPVVWAGDRLFIPGRTFPVEASQALTFALGSDGASLPAIPGTEVALDIAERIDLRLFAFHPNPTRAEPDAPHASIIDLAAGTRVDYAPGEHSIRFTAPPDRATAVGDRTVALTIDGAIYLHDRSLYREPRVVRDITPGRAPGIAPAIYIDADPMGSRLWIFDYGQHCCDEEAPAHPGIVRLVDTATGDTILNTETEPNVLPVQASDRGLLVNFEEFVPTADAVVSDPDSHTYAVLQPGGTFTLAGEGHATAIADDAVVRVRCTGLVDQECTLRITDEATGNRAVDPPGAAVWVQFSQPGTSLASPDGRWVVAAARRVNDVNGAPIPVLVDVRLGTAEALSFGRFDRPGVVVAWDDTSRWLVILGAEPVAFNVESKQFIQLGNIVPEGLLVFAAG